MTSVFFSAVGQQQVRDAMRCQEKRERWIASGLKVTVKRRMRGVWVVHDVNGAPCAIRASFRDAYNTAYARAYERDVR